MGVSAVDEPRDGANGLALRYGSKVVGADADAERNPVRAPCEGSGAGEGLGECYDGASAEEAEGLDGAMVGGHDGDALVLVGSGEEVHAECRR